MDCVGCSVSPMVLKIQTSDKTTVDASSVEVLGTYLLGMKRVWGRVYKIGS